MTKPDFKPDSRAVDSALALLVANTRMAERPGMKRPHPLTEIAAAIRVAEKGFGSQKAVAERLGIGTEMLRRFLSVEKLRSVVIPSVASRRIDSLNQVLHMAALPKADQPAVAEALLGGRLTGADIRALAPLRKRRPKADICTLIDQVTNSRDRTVYAVVFPSSGDGNLAAVRKGFEQAAGVGLVALRREGSQRYKAVLTRSGLRNLRLAAKKDGKSLRQYVKSILTGVRHGTK